MSMSTSFLEGRENATNTKNAENADSAILTSSTSENFPFDLQVINREFIDRLHCCICFVAHFLYISLMQQFSRLKHPQQTTLFMKYTFFSAKLKIASFSVRNNRRQLPFSQIFQQRKLPESAESVSVNLLRSPAIDSQPGEPVRQPYLLYRPARLHRLTESIPRN